MDKKELFDFVRKYNQSFIISNETIIEGLEKLPKKDHNLFMLLVNYKNNKEFKNSLKDGGFNA